MTALEHHDLQAVGGHPLAGLRRGAGGISLLRTARRFRDFGGRRLFCTLNGVYLMRIEVVRRES